MMVKYSYSFPQAVKMCDYLYFEDQSITNGDKKAAFLSQNDPINSLVNLKIKCN